MQLDDRVAGLEQKLARTTTVVYVLVVFSLGLLGTNLYMVSRQNVSFDSILIRDRVAIGDEQKRLSLDRSSLNISSDGIVRASLTPMSFGINNMMLTDRRLYLGSAPTQLVLEVSPDEGKFLMSNDSGIFSVNLGLGGLGIANLSLIGPQQEVFSAMVGKGDAEIRVKNSKSKEKTLTP